MHHGICCAPLSITCPSHAGVLSKRMNGSSWFVAQRPPTSCCNLQRKLGISRNKDTSLWKFSPYSELSSFLYFFTRARRRCCRRLCLTVVVYHTEHPLLFIPTCGRDRASCVSSTVLLLMCKQRIGCYISREQSLLSCTTGD